MAMGRCSIHVVPNDPRRCAAAALQFIAPSTRCSARRRSSEQGEGSEFEALREYMPGLDHRSIDWKHSARHRKLVCKEFRTERNHQIVLAFDTGHLMQEPLDGIPKLDHAINAGLLLAFVSLKAGDRVGLYGVRCRRSTAISQPIGGSAELRRVRAAGRPSSTTSARRPTSRWP